MRDEFPTMPELPAEDLAELRTLQEIVDYMNEMAGGGQAAPVPQAQAAPAPAPQSAPQTAPTPAAAPAPSSGGGLSVEALSAAMLTIVSDKTGYPTEMLELDMDIEADLGIDSIKRVEILGAMRDEFPAMPELPAEDLAELRTLQEIVDYMNEMAGGSSQPTPPTGGGQAAPQAQAAPAPQSAPQAAPQVPAPAPASGGGLSVEALSAAMLTIVSDKTGYPTEMLELDMDIEADLGIDSIKRVEILGAMRDEFPAMPELPAEDLAELRTLQEIVDYMNEMAGGVPAASNGHSQNGIAPKAPAPEVNGNAAPALPTLDHDIPREPVALHYLPAPDQIEVAWPQDSVCVITDDGTPLTGKLTEALTALGWRVAVLGFPADTLNLQSALPGGVPRVELPDFTEVRLEEALAAITADYGYIAAFIHVNPPGRMLGGRLFNAAEKDILKHVFLLAKHLKKPLTDAAQQGDYAAFFTVARLDGALGTQGGDDYGAISGGLFGLTKTVNLEWPDVYCRALDVAANLTDEDATNAIVGELLDPERRLVDVAYNTEGRFTLVAKSATV